MLLSDVYLVGTLQSFLDKKTGQRSTRISPFHSKKCQHSLSLVPFLLCKIPGKADAVEAAAPAEGDASAGGRETLQEDPAETLPVDLASVHIRMRGERDDEKYVLVSDSTH